MSFLMALAISAGALVVGLGIVAPAVFMLMTGELPAWMRRRRGLGD